MFNFLKRKPRMPVIVDGTIRRHYRFYGKVQCVGFRYQAKYAAETLGITGWVKNLDDGSVEMEAQGTPDVLDKLVPMIDRSDYIKITGMETVDEPVNPYEWKFRVMAGDAC